MRFAVLARAIWMTYTENLQAETKGIVIVNASGMSWIVILIDLTGMELNMIAWGGYGRDV